MTRLFATNCEGGRLQLWIYSLASAVLIIGISHRKMTLHEYLVENELVELTRRSGEHGPGAGSAIFHHELERHVAARSKAGNRSCAGQRRRFSPNGKPSHLAGHILQMALTLNSPLCGQFSRR